MTAATMIVMLLWVGDFRGGPAVIQGFHTLKACQDSVPIVLKKYAIQPKDADCAELPTGATDQPIATPPAPGQ